MSLSVTEQIIELADDNLLDKDSLIMNLLDFLGEKGVKKFINQPDGGGVMDYLDTYFDEDGDRIQ